MLNEQACAKLVLAGFGLFWLTPAAGLFAGRGAKALDVRVPKPKPNYII